MVSVFVYVLFSEQLQLDIFRRGLAFLFLRKQFHSSELFVRHGQNADLAERRKKLFHPLDMHLGILRTRTMPHVD